MTAAWPDPELLLVHTRFVRGVAGTLVRTDAEDLAQDAWVRALQQPPQHQYGILGWWSTMLRRLAANARRAQERRRTREASAVEPSAVPTPDEILIKEEIRRRVVAAVLALEEPFREVVLLRFYEELAPHEIAQRLGVPAATVRTRLSRAIGRLRARLDRECAGERSAWLGPLALWSVPTLDAGVVGGVLLMTKKLSIVAAASLLLWLPLVLWWNSGEVPPEADAREPVAASSVLASPEGTAPDATSRVGDELATDRVAFLATDESAAPIYPAARGDGALHGIAVDSAGVPFAGLRVELTPRIGPLPWGASMRDDRDAVFRATTDHTGRFRFATVPEGPWLLSSRAGNGWESSLVVFVQHGRDDGPICLELAVTGPPDDVRILVHDETGAAVAGAVVEAHLGSPSGEPLASGDAPNARVTDANGEAGFAGVRHQRGVFVARGPDGRVGCHARWNSYDRDVRIPLTRPAAIRGRVLGSDDLQVDGRRVRVHLMAGTGIGAASWSTASEISAQRFEVTDLPPGSYRITLEPPLPLELADAPPTRGGVPTLRLSPGETADATFTASRGAAIHGQVRDAQARPVAGAYVRVAHAEPARALTRAMPSPRAALWALDLGHSDGPRDPGAYQLATTDRDGRYVVGGLRAGTYRIEVAAAMLSIDRTSSFDVAEGQILEREHRLLPAGVLQVVAPGASEVEHGRVSRALSVAPRETSAKPILLATCADGTATLPGIPAGEYGIGLYPVHAGSVPRVLEYVTVAAGRTTHVDLRDRLPRASITGRLTCGDVPVVGALIRWRDCMAQTDAGGSFTLDLGCLADPGKLTELPLSAAVAGIVHRFRLPPPTSEPAQLQVDLELGQHELLVRVVDAAGVPQRAQLSLATWGGSDVAPGSVLRSDAPRARGWCSETRFARLWADRSYRVDARFESGAETSMIVRVPTPRALELVHPGERMLRIHVVDERGLPVAGTEVTAWDWYGDGAVPESYEEFLHRTRSGWRKAHTDRHGWAEFRGVRLGPAFVQGAGRASQPKLVHIADVATTEVTLVQE